MGESRQMLIRIIGVVAVLTFIAGLVLAATAFTDYKWVILALFCFGFVLLLYGNISVRRRH
jgi:hypothetical protein